MAQREMQRTRLPAYQQHARKRRLPCPHETPSYTDIKTGLPTRPLPSCTEMVKTAAQLKDHYTKSHTDCMIEYEVEKIMAHRTKKGNPISTTI
jgi:hypothetical protein